MIEEVVSFYGVGDVNANSPCEEPLEECREPLESAHLSSLRTWCNGKKSCTIVNAEWVFTTDCDMDRTDVEQVTYMCLDGQSMFICQLKPPDTRR